MVRAIESVPRAAAGLEFRAVADRPLRLLGVGDAQSIIFLRWAWQLAERGHDVHVVSDRITERPDELEGLTVHDVRELDVRDTGQGAPPVRLRSRSSRSGRAARRRPRARPLPPAVRLVGARGRTSIRSSCRPWNTDIFTYGRERRRGRKRVRRRSRRETSSSSSSLANAEETIRLGAAADKVNRIVWYVDLRPFGPEHRDPGLRARLGWPEDSLVVLSLRNYRPNTNLDVLVRAFARVRSTRCPRRG